MTPSLKTGLKRVAAAGALLGLVAIGTTAAPTQANAWWRGGYGYGYGCCGGIGIFVPPIVVAPPVYAPAPVYYAPPPPPAYYAPPQRAWVPAHWQNGYWVQAHWE